jgi:hypothetical protein
VQARAACGFIANLEGTRQALWAAVHDHTAERGGDHPRLLIAHDTITLSHGQHHLIDCLGPVAHSGARGLLVRASLAVSQGGVPMGRLGQHVLAPARGRRPDRETTIALRHTTVGLNPREGEYPSRGPLPLNVVPVAEQAQPADEAPLQWCPVTTWPVADAAAAPESARIHTVRWRVEEFDLTLKGGCWIESHPLDSGERSDRGPALLNPVASLLRHRSSLARAERASPATPALQAASQPVLRGYTAAERNRADSEPLALATVALLGRLGGTGAQVRQARGRASGVARLARLPGRAACRADHRL